MINIGGMVIKPAALLLTAIFLISSAAACIPSVPANPSPENPPPAFPISSQPPVPTATQQPEPNSGVAVISNSENTAQPQTGPAVEIMLIHHRGTLTRIGCCNPMLYERDEFVVIQNRSDTPQDITDWSLANVTRGYPVFRFPSHFPCIPYVVKPEDEETVSGGTYTVIQNPAQSVVNSLTTSPTTTKPTNQPSGEMDWAACNPVEPLDQTPMKPAKGQQGLPVPCILYPGQTILVFTDEVHCSSGGFSFNWGQGNIWNNEIADTAVLYNSAGVEISRKSYTIGR